MKIKIECSKEELILIERALELYGRVGMLQFDYLTLNNSLQKKIWEKDLTEKFKYCADNMKHLFGYTPNSNPGIFNTDMVGDDCRTAIHLYQQLRHERYKFRIKTGEQTQNFHTVDEYPADICQIADIELPNFKIECYE